MAPLFLLLSVFFLPPLSLAQDPVHIQLIRRYANQARSIDYVAEAERIRDRYGYSRISNETKKRATAAIPIINQVCPHIPHHCRSKLTTRNNRTETRVTLASFQSVLRRFFFIELLHINIICGDADLSSLSWWKREWRHNPNLGYDLDHLF